MAADRSVLICVSVIQSNGPPVEDDLLAAAVAEHVRKSGEFIFSVDMPDRHFASARFGISGAEVVTDGA